MTIGKTIRGAVLVGVVAAAAALTVSTRPASAYDRLAPWCAQPPGDIGIPACSFYTFQQCVEFIRGVSQLCMPNPAVVMRQADENAPPPPAARKRPKRYISQ